MLLIVRYKKDSPAIYGTVLSNLCNNYYSAGLRAVYIILRAEHLRSSCLTSVTIPMRVFSSA